jgi:hypothetical protein
VYEHRHSPLLPRRAFYARVANSAGVGLILIVVSLGIGTLGYHHYSDPQLGWSAAFENAAMILSGMGPVDNDNLESTGARIFAGLYALYSGFALITIAGIVFAPIFHRFLHKFHLDTEKRKEKAG